MSHTPDSRPALSFDSPSWTRREFLRSTSAAAALASLAPWEAVAGPFTRPDFEKLVPADKKLSPEWVRSLFARGTRTVYRGAELEKIGMPVGGICAGQVYLGGDGRLWHWDIFNQHIGTGAEHYARPLQPQSPLEQGFALQLTAGGQTQTRRLDRTGWRDIEFTGEYPLGFVTYRDAEAPVTVQLEAFSPFIPLNVEDSSLPATVMRFTVINHSRQRMEVELAGWLENAVGLHSAPRYLFQRRNRIVRRPGLLALVCAAEAAPPSPAPERPDVVFDDFERPTHEGWTVTGTAFGAGPVSQAQVPEYQGKLGFHGQRGINSHAAAPAQDVGGRDAHKGTLTSRPFVIERNYIHFLIGGGAHAGRTCLNLLVEDRVVLSATGHAGNDMRLKWWDVRPWLGRSARLQVVDDESGAWGNIGVDYIVFSDAPPPPPGPLEEAPDFGTMALVLLPPEGTGKIPNTDRANAALPEPGTPAGLFAPAPAANEAVRPSGQKLLGALTRRLVLAPGASATATFAVCWHFPNLRMDRLPPGRYYGTRFGSALGVAEYLAAQFASLYAQTKLWHDTWYDSTLPYWFLDRTFLNISTLATSTCHRLSNGRFWGWEGVGCCHGTCTHVWNYAQAVARLFPQLERDTRERVDFGLALQKDGAIFFRAEHNNYPAVDGQAGTILRALREHQTGADDAWLRRNWPGIKRAMQWLIAKDEDGDGLITSNQHNTLDTDWYGPVAWLSGVYLSALRAAEAMAQEVGDEAFAREYRGIFERGRKNLVSRLFDGEYFINQPDPKHLDAINSGSGCHIDQVLGQSWAWQMGLGRVLPEAETRSALRSLWRYNFTPDVGPYREVYRPGRWYAMPGEGGLLMCTFPRTDWDYPQARGKGAEWAAGYFNECMNGFEYQVAGHMIAEGMLMEGLAITRMIHDRYHPLRRNPWNEVECGDHYARSMASYGVFLMAAGFEYHGPRGLLGFAPRLTPENFRCAFTSAEGWGTFAQRREGGQMTAEIILKWGRLRLATLKLTPPARPARVRIARGKQVLTAGVDYADGALLLRFSPPLMLGAGETLQASME
jgi:uncharacterized protein (DUF608 family)